jgi:hypothetical protein
MRRTTVMLPDDLARLVEVEKAKRQVSTAEIVRLALEEFVKPRHGGGKRYSFFGLGASGHTDTSRNVEEILAQEWTVERLTGRDS